MDSGDILIQKGFDIPYKYSYGEYDDKIAEVAGQCYMEVLAMLCDGNLKPQKQLKEGGVIARRIQDEEYKLDFDKLSRKETFHYLYGTDALNHIYKSILFQYKALDPCEEKKSEYSIQCKDGYVYYEKYFNLGILIRKLACLILAKIRIKSI